MFAPSSPKVRVRVWSRTATAVAKAFCGVDGRGTGAYEHLFLPPSRILQRRYAGERRRCAEGEALTRDVNGSGALGQFMPCGTRRGA